MQEMCMTLFLLFLLWKDHSKNRVRGKVKAGNTRHDKQKPKYLFNSCKINKQFSFHKMTNRYAY